MTNTITIREATRAAGEKTRPRILCVDDEANVLAGLQRALRRRFDVTAAGPAEALEALNGGSQFEAVISDLRMPGTDGITLLEHARAISPDTVRLLLSGQADLASALDAVNRGAIFRFLVKPCSQEALESALLAAVEQHRLLTSERVLLEQTLHGSIKALTDILALINPAGFGRAARAKALVGELAESAGVAERWQVEVAAMLSQIGTVTLPPATVEKLYAGKPLAYTENMAVERLPKVACDVIRNIPRLGAVEEILAQQNLRFDGVRAPKGQPSGAAICWGARALKLILDFDVLESQGLSRSVAIDTLRSREGVYDPGIIELLSEVCGYSGAHVRVMELELAAVRPGMLFAEDVRTVTGILLVARGQEVSDRLAERIRNFLHLVEAKQKVKVIDPGASAKTAPERNMAL